MTSAFVVLSPNNVRRIGPRETGEVEQLHLKNTKYLFGPSLPELHLSRRWLSLGLYQDKHLVGAVTFDDHPNIPALPPWEWAHWLYNLYRIQDKTPMNTTFIHYAVWDRHYTNLFLKPVLQNLFQSNDYLDTVIMVCPPGIQRLEFIEDYATRVLPKGFLNPGRVTTVYVMKREDFTCHYVIRRAVEEDNDDLVAIIPEILETTYGQFYISELLSLHETGRQIIVSEYRGKAVGVLCLNETVNFELLNEEFELVPFNGLRKPDEADEVLSQQCSTGALVVEDVEMERLSPFATHKEKLNESVTESEHVDDNNSEDDFSILDFDTSLIFNYLYENDSGSQEDQDGSVGSIESQYSAVVLNEDYEDHLYSNFDRRESDVTVAAPTSRRTTKSEKERRLRVLE